MFAVKRNQDLAKSTRAIRLRAITGKKCGKNPYRLKVKGAFMSKRFFVGVDSGTSVVKAVLTDLGGEELAVAVENTPVETPREGWSEFDLHQDWEGVGRAISKLLYVNQVAPEEIMAVAVTGKAWGCCYLDRNNEPVRKGILWNDARSGPYIREWVQSGVLSEVFRINGNYYWPGDYAPITRWFIDEEPHNVGHVTTALLPSDWIVYKLTGKLKVVHGDVSSLFDIKRREYSDTLFDLLGISSMRDKFPNPTSSTQVAGEVTREAAEATHLKVGTPRRPGWSGCEYLRRWGWSRRSGRCVHHLGNRAYRVHLLRRSRCEARDRDVFDLRRWQILETGGPDGRNHKS